MTTKTVDERLEEMHDRIDRLQARAHESGADGRASIKRQVNALRRQEQSARAAVQQAHEHAAMNGADRTGAAEAKLRQLETRANAAEHGLAAELAEDKEAFVAAMNADLAELEAFFHRLDARAAAKTGRARDEAEAAISDLRRMRNKVSKRLVEVRDSSDDRWRERKNAVTAARAELERKIDDVLKKFQ